MKLYIKYMASLSSKTVARIQLNRLNIAFRFIKDGVVVLSADITPALRNELKLNLQPFGLKLHEKKKGVLIEKIKSAIREMITYPDGHPIPSHSEYLSEKLDYDYTYLANIFSEVSGITIQQYIIISKIEKVKEYLLLSKLNLSEISFRLHYSSVAHLSGQFKKVTGLTPSAYKLLKQTTVI